MRLHLGAFSGQWHGFSRNKLALFVQRHVKWGLLWRVWQRSSSTITMGHFLLPENALFKYFRHTYHHCHAKAHGWNAYFVVNTIELWPTSTLCLHYTKLRITKEKNTNILRHIKTLKTKARLLPLSPTFGWLGGRSSAMWITILLPSWQPPHGIALWQLLPIPCSLKWR